MTRLQRAVARRMSAAKAEIPEFVTEIEVDMAAASAVRRALRSAGGFVPSYNDLVVKACALALRRVPHLNASFGEDHVTLHDRINIGVAVATERALTVPTIFDADRKTLEEIARDASALAEKVRAGSIRVADLAGATFTVSNLGMHGITRFIAVINPPQAGILAVGAVQDRVVAHDGEPEIRARLTVTLSADHRVVYGAEAAEFLNAIRAGLETPQELIA
jgi:pyruvate dehydrogenase E2 component (dihydrolipoamide acetyltransferase)